MNPIPRLAELLDIPELRDCRDPGEWFTRRDEIKATTKPNVVGLAPSRSP